MERPPLPPPVPSWLVEVVDVFGRWSSYSYPPLPVSQVPVGLFNKVIVVGPKKIHIRLTDEFLRFQRPESAFTFSLVHEEGEACTIQLEPVVD